MSLSVYCKQAKIRRSRTYAVMNRTRRISLFVASLACFSAPIRAYAAPPTAITSVPFNITVPGRYVLNNDVTLAPSTSVYAIFISCSDVTLDLNGHTITGPGATALKNFGVESANSTGIVGAISNIVVKNGSLIGFKIGIVLFSGTGTPGTGLTDCVFRNITITAPNDAISDAYGTGNRFTDCTIVQGPNTTSGITLTNCTNDVVSRNHFPSLPTPSIYQNIIIQGTVGGNNVLNDDDVAP
jgi:hypothetical protein